MIRYQSGQVAKAPGRKVSAFDAQVLQELMDALLDRSLVFMRHVVALTVGQADMCVEVARDKPAHAGSQARSD